MGCYSGEPVTESLPDHPPSYWEQNTERLDWKKIAMKAGPYFQAISYLGFSHGASDLFPQLSSSSNAPTRSPDELRVRWLGHAHPKFSHAVWTPEETTRVKQIVEDMKKENNGGKVDWVKIAEALGVSLPFLGIFIEV